MSKQLLDTASKHSFSLSGLADNAWNRLYDAAFRTGWKPLSRLAESAVVAYVLLCFTLCAKVSIRLMQKITIGHLRVLTLDHIYEFPPSDEGNPHPDLRAELRVVNDAFWLRLCFMGDLGFSEAYMYGDVVCDDLVSLFLLFLANRENLAGIDSGAMSYLFTIPQKLTSYRFLNTLGNSRSNISAHYDISNEMFASFLSRDMTYSCAIFDTLDGDLVPNEDRTAWSGGQGLLRIGASPPVMPSIPLPKNDPLEAAQTRKLNHILQKAKIQPGHRVLEIGSGWGSMAIFIAQNVPDTTVDTLTLSVQQKRLAEDRIRNAGLESRIRVHLTDYRSMPNEWQGSFDRVVSIEMIEAVGHEYLPTYWSVVDWAMRKQDAVGVVQVITIPEPRFDRYLAEIDFIRKWIFPGGFLPTLTLLLETMRTGSSGRLIVDSVSNIGPHYARTLREWRKRFIRCFDSHIVPSLKKEYPDVMCGERGREEIEVFRRKWIYYYCYCEVGFTTRTLGDHIITFGREGNQSYGCQVFN